MASASSIQSLKSSSDWSPNELFVYNITVTAQLPQEFFCQNTEPSLDDIDPSIINSAVDADDVSDCTFHYHTDLDLATHPTQESFINGFSQLTLHILGFEE